MTWELIKQTAMIRLYTWWNIPLLWWVRPTIIENSKQRAVFMLPLSRRTKNHLGVMYFGALAMGAEAAVALKAVKVILDSGEPVDYIFKDFSANFHKRAEGDVHFICEEGPGVEALVAKAIQSGQRESQTFHSYGIVPAKSTTEKVAEFSVTLSVKKRSKKN
jgi:acyl-coenzyme A thioesterase PaaI-like protein